MNFRPRCRIIAVCSLCVLQSAFGLTRNELSLTETLLERSERAVSEFYYPRARVDDAFRQSCISARATLASAENPNAAFLIIADTLRAFDPLIRFLPPPRPVWADYGWRWQLIGDEGYVVQVDTNSDAAQKGLRLGDRIVSIEGMPLDRASADDLHYLFQTLIPLPGLQIEVQSETGEVRPLALAATVRERGRMHDFQGPLGLTLQRTLTAREKQLKARFENVEEHIHRHGQVAIWRAVELQREATHVHDALKAMAGAEAIVVDLRGLEAWNPRVMLRALEGFFAADFAVGTIKKDSLGEDLRVKGSSKAFKGTLLVLIDAETAGYPEVFAHVVQQQRRGVVIGDRTLGRVTPSSIVSSTPGQANAFTISRVLLPRGKLVLASGAQLVGTGVAPDLQVLPKPDDLAHRRDVALSRALRLVKQTLSPEDAYRLIYEEELDEDR